MADLSSLLAVLEHDPDDVQALDALAGAARAAPAEVRATRFAVARKTLAGRGRPDAVVALIDVELAATDDKDRKADLMLEQGMVLDGELLVRGVSVDVRSETVREAAVRRIRDGIGRQEPGG